VPALPAFCPGVASTHHGQVAPLAHPPHAPQVAERVVSPGCTVVFPRCYEPVHWVRGLLEPHASAPPHMCRPWGRLGPQVLRCSCRQGARRGSERAAPRRVGVGASSAQTTGFLSAPGGEQERREGAGSLGNGGGGGGSFLYVLSVPQLDEYN
jgi:hypothetical protein